MDFLRGLILKNLFIPSSLFAHISAFLSFSLLDYSPFGDLQFYLISFYFCIFYDLLSFCAYVYFVSICALTTRYSTRVLLVLLPWALAFAPFCVGAPAVFRAAFLCFYLPTLF